MAKAKTAPVNTEISVLPISYESASIFLVGHSPMIFNRMAEKGWRELLFPTGRKTAADRAQSLKHSPLDEFRASVHRYNDDSQPTRLKFLSSGVRRAMATAALDIPGARKSEIGRLTWIDEKYFPVFGVPELMMSIVRSADPKRTPDVRSRAVIRHWACSVEIKFLTPKLNATTICNLISASGLLCGIGDWRQEKGSGSHGQYRIADPDDAELAHIMKTGGLEVQDAALASPSMYDEETEEMYAWFGAELGRRTRNDQRPKAPKRIEQLGGDDEADWIVPPTVEVPATKPRRAGKTASAPNGGPDKIAPAAVSVRATKTRRVGRVSNGGA